MRTIFKICFDDGHQKDFWVSDINKMPSRKIHTRFMNIVNKYIRKNYPDEASFGARLYRRWHDGSYGKAISAANISECSFCEWDKL